MDQLTAIRTFLRVAELENFTAASEQLGIARSLASRRVRDLEEVLGTPLLLRTTRRVRLTEAGLHYRERMAPIIEQMDAIEAEVSAGAAALRGSLRVSCPTSFGISFLGPALACFLDKHPEIRAEVILNDREIDPVEEGYDLVLSDSDRVSGQYHEEPICRMALACVAAPAYLKGREAPQVPADLRQHAAIQYLHAGSGQDWAFERDGQRHTVTVSPVASSNNGGIMRSFALAGRGIAILPRFLCAADLEAGRLREVLPDYTVPTARLRAVLPRRRGDLPKTRLLAEFLIQHFAAFDAAGVPAAVSAEPLAA
ncbi:MAG TPA: LysR family transcriptional regulator [Xanthomonadaceae bacterium]|nr:LysR family transcriptional regulator [Xanthomonadaceae bacterium]